MTEPAADRVKDAVAEPNPGRLPVWVQANEVLRSLLFGANALLAGSDAEVEDSLLDDLRDLYTFFGTRAEGPPSMNIAADLQTLALDRLSQLKALVDGILAGGDPPDPAAAEPAHVIHRTGGRS